MKSKLLSVIGYAFSLSIIAQANSQAPVTVQAACNTMSNVTETSRTTQAVNYLHEKGITKIGFAGTSLMPNSTGTAKIQINRGTMEVDAEFINLTSPTTFGSEYLTYVMWAIPEEGRAVNLGEVLLNHNGRSKLTGTTDLHAFALIVTAEPYYAVHLPSSMVVLENVIRANSKEASGEVEVKYEVVGGEKYRSTGSSLEPGVMKAGLPLSYYEARNAMQIAKSEGAEQYNDDTYQHAVLLMQTTNDYATGAQLRTNHLNASARATVQMAEDAREMAELRTVGAHRTDERQVANEAKAKSLVNDSEKTLVAEQALVDASKAQVELASYLMTSAEVTILARAETEKTNMTAALTQKSANQFLGQAGSDKVIIRARLSLQLNLLFATRDSERGLILNISDKDFNTGQNSLTSDARVTLAKVAGILAAYPSLTISIGGLTGNSGGDAMNRSFYENRADSVRDYLVKAGIGAQLVSAQDVRNSTPIVTSENSIDREENRRVELVVAGEMIGGTANTTVGRLR